MKFKLTRTSVKAFIRSVQEAKNCILGVNQNIIWEQYDLEARIKPFDNSIVLFIQINTIEEIMYLQNIIGYPIIIEGHNIEIYDKYLK